MTSGLSSTIQSSILSLLLSRLPLHPLDIPQQSSFTFKGNSGGPSFHLTDITLDIDKLQTQYLPPSTPINIRHAQVKDLQIKISTSGIQINVEDLTCVISPKASIENGQFSDPTNSIILKSLDDPLEGLEGMMESVVGFVDAVSGVNSFTSTTGNNNDKKWGDEVFDEDDLDSTKLNNTAKSLKEILANDKELTGDLENNLNTDPKSSNTILSYAIDYLMGKIAVSFEKLHIKIIADPIVSMVTIDKIDANGSKAERKCTVEGISVSIINPVIGENEKKEKKDYYEDDSNFEQDIDQNMGVKSDDDDYNDEIMSSSFMAESKDDIQQSLMESAMYSTSGKSLYMSATQGDFYDAPTHITEANTTTTENTANTMKDYASSNEDIGTVLLTVDVIKLSLKERQELSIEIGKIKISLIPIPKFSTFFLDFLIYISKQKALLKPKLKPEKSKASNLSSTTNIILHLFSILDIEISLNSLLSTSGEFIIDSSYRFHGASFILEQKSSTLIQGSMQTFEFVTADNKQCLNFESTQTSQPDIRIELQIEEESHVTSVIVEKPLVIDIDYLLVEYLLSFWLQMNPTMQKLNELKLINLNKYKYLRGNSSLRVSNKSTTNSKRSEIILKFSSIDGQIGLSEDEHDHLNIEISPLLYVSMNKITTIDTIKITLNTLKGKVDIDIDTLRHVMHGDKLAKFRSFDVIAQKDVTYNTKQTFTVEKVRASSSYEALSYISEVIIALYNKIKPNDEPIKKETKVQFESMSAINRNMGSSFLFKPKVINFYALIKHLSYSIDNINDKFGGISGVLRNIGLTSLSEGTNQISVHEITMNKVHDGLEEIIIGKANKHVVAPMIFAKLEKSHSIFLNNWLLNYSGKWLAMFEKVGNDKFDSPILVSSNSEFGSAIMKQRLRKKATLEFFVSLTDISIGLKPVNLDSEAIMLINKASSDIVFYNDKTVVTQLTSNRIGLLLIDDTKNIKTYLDEKRNTSGDWDMQSIWINKGYVSIGNLSTVVTKVKINTIESLRLLTNPDDNRVVKSLIDAQLDVAKVNLDLCCDSAQCFLQLLKDLKKPIYFSYDDKYKETTKNVDIFDNIELNFFNPVKQNEMDKTNLGNLNSESLPPSNFKSDNSKEDLTIVENFYDNVKNYSCTSNNSDSLISNKDSTSGEVSISSSHFDRQNGKSVNNKVIPINLHVSIALVGISLYDGYDWKETRTQIRRALKRVSEKARLLNNKAKESTNSGTSMDTNNNSMDGNNPTSEVVEETLYQSIMLGVGTEDNPRKVYEQISENIGGYKNGKYDKRNDERAEYTQTIDLGKSKNNPLRLKRSVKNKVFVELEDVDVGFKLLSNNEPHLKEKPDFFSKHEGLDDSELVNEIEINVNNLVITDNIPTSSWNMFAGYMRESGEREIGKNMMKVNIELVRPIARMAAIEMIMQISILPLRLYVDQDTLDFLTRFGEFKDQRFIPANIENEEMFLEKFVVDTVKLKLDYKPKKFDYAGIRSGHTSEFMNIFILDESEITLNKVTLYGVPGFSKLNTLLNGFWSPDVKKNQLAGVLSGLAPFRSIINIGSGVNNLVSVPMKEYKKDGRVVRSLQVGALEFSKITGGEILKLGAKLAAGTQTILENTEEALGGSGSSSRVVRDDLGYERARNSERKYNNRRRRSSTASFGDEEESDYHRYFFHQNKTIIKKNKGDGDSNMIAESIMDFDDDDDDDEGDDGDEVAISDDFESDSDDDFKDIGGSDNNTNNNKVGGMYKKMKEYKSQDEYVVSLYSDQPRSLNEGLKTAYSSIQRNLNTARDAIYDASLKASEADNASGAMMELARATPVVLIRPAIAATEAISKSLLGGVNDINPEERRKAEEKYKKVGRIDEDGEESEID